MPMNYYCNNNKQTNKHYIMIFNKKNRQNKMESIPEMKEIHLKQILFSLVFSPFFHFISLNSSSFISLHMHCFCFSFEKIPENFDIFDFEEKKSSADSQNDDSIL